MKELNEIIVQLMNVSSPVYDNPNELTKGLIALSAHLYQIGNTIIDAERKFAEKWQVMRVEYKSDRACDVAMKTTKEYRELQQRKNAQEMMLEIIRSIKHRVKVLSDEYRIT